MLITIGRQYGAGGREIGEKLAKELQIPLYDRKLISLISEHLKEGHNLNELSLTYKNLYGNGYPYEDIFNDVIHDDETLLFSQQEKTIKLLAAQNNSGVFIGRCANAILSDYKVYSFFIVANNEFKTFRGKTVYNRTLAELKREDAKRAAFYNYYSGLIWGNAEDHDLVINTGKTDINGAVTIIKEYINTIIKS